MNLYALIDIIENDIYGIFLSNEDATDYLKTDVYEESHQDFVIREFKCNDKSLKVLNNKITEYLTDDNMK